MREPKDPVLVALGARIRELRDVRGMTQAELSKAAGINRITLSKIERGHEDVGILRLTRLATSLDVSVADVLEADGRNAT